MASSHSVFTVTMASLEHRIFGSVAGTRQVVKQKRTGIQTRFCGFDQRRQHSRVAMEVSTQQGDDGIIRVVQVKTADGIYSYKRAVRQLCPLPFEGNTD